MDDHTTKHFNSEGIGAVVARWLAPPGQFATEQPPAVGPTMIAVLDEARLADVRAAMRSQIVKILVKVLEALEEHMAVLGQARAKGDVTAIGEVVHRIKNTAGNIGATRSHELAGAFECDIGSKPPRADMLHALGPAMVEALAAIRQAIDEERNR